MSYDARERVRMDHRSLKELFGTARDLLASSDGNVRIQAAHHLQEALEVHFAQEDSLYYPTILALRPEHRKELQACMEAHDEFRDHLDRLVESARRGSQADALRVFEELAERFDQHEAAEESVLAAIDAEASAR